MGQNWNTRPKHLYRKEVLRKKDPLTGSESGQVGGFFAPKRGKSVLFSGNWGSNQERKSTTKGGGGVKEDDPVQRKTI